MDNILPIAIIGAGLAYFATKETDGNKSALKQQEEDRNAFNNTINETAGLVAEVQTVDPKTQEELDLLTAELEIIDKRIAEYKTQLQKLINQRRSCSMCAIKLHLSNLNKYYYGLLGLGAVISVCQQKGFEYKCKELEQYLNKPATIDNQPVPPSSISQLVENTVNDFKSSVSNVVNNVVNNAQSAVGNVVNNAQSAVGNAFNNVSDATKNAANSLVNHISTSFGSAASNTVKKLFSW